MAAVSHAPAPLTVLEPAEPPGHPERRGLHVQATGLARVLRRGSRILDDVTLAIEPGEVVAIIGASGAGKTTLLDALAGVRPASHGTVRFDGLDIAQHGGAFRTLVGYVPQDDIIHRDLPVETTLRYAARLRLPDDRPRRHRRRRRSTPWRPSTSSTAPRCGSVRSAAASASGSASPSSS